MKSDVDEQCLKAYCFDAWRNAPGGTGWLSKY